MRGALASVRKCVVLPTTEVPEGISAAIVFDPSLDFDTNVEEMTEAFKRIKCGEVTMAIRNTELDGFKISEGDYIGLDSKKIVSKADSVDKAVTDLVEKIKDDDNEVITLYYGQDVKESDANALVEKLEKRFDDCEVVCYNGGQPHYYYMVAVE